MTFNSTFRAIALAGAAMLATSSLQAADASRVAMFVADAPSAQEQAALEYFSKTYGGTVLTPATISTLNADDFDAVWVHIDRCGMGMGYQNLPEDYKGGLEQLNSFVKGGGSLYLSKHATQMAAEMGRLDSKYQVNIFGDGDGGAGSDDWTINACIGTWQLNPDNSDPDLSQVYDHRSHAIFAGLDVHGKEVQGYPHESFPMEGTGDPATSMHREDHNCCWDLNPFAPLYAADGKNTVEKWEADTNSTVLATWGHVQDYCVAGIVEFLPTDDYKGTVVANGLAACEWAPREGGNLYHSNLEKLTTNTLNYLAEKSESGVAAVTAAEAAPAYYTIQGAKVSAPAQGLYIKVENGRASKVMIR